MSEKTYELHLAGVTRYLHFRQLAEHVIVPSFVMLGDTELIEACAEALVKILPEGADYLVCPEAKAIPLTHSMARRLGINYIVVRKTVKAYMKDPIIVSVNSITTSEQQKLVLDGLDAEKLDGKKVIIVDDVVATGGSLQAVENLLAKTNCQVIAKAAPLRELAGYNGTDLIYIQEHPVFTEMPE